MSSPTADPSPGSHLVARIKEGSEALKARELENALELLASAADEAREAELPALQASACGLLAQVLFLMERQEEAAEQARRALEIAEELGQLGAARHFRELLAMIDPESEIEPEEATVVATRGPVDFFARLKEAQEQAKSGGIADAFKRFSEIAEDARELEARGPEASARIYLAQLLLANQEPEPAAEEARRALAIAEELGDERAAAHIRDLLHRAGG